MPIAVAVLGGALATLNPCGFALLLAFLSGHLTSDDQPPSGSRVLHGLAIGTAITAGFLVVFAAIGLPIALGVGQISRAVPWLEFGLGLALAIIAVTTLAGIPLRLPEPGIRTGTISRQLRGVVVFGFGYGLTSMSCTLPIFLVVIGTSLTTHGNLGAVVVFAGYAAGMTLVLLAVAVGAALMKDALARLLGRVISQLRWINGGLLLVVSGYLTYYWSITLFTSARTRAHAPLMHLEDHLTTHLQAWGTAAAGRWVLGTATIFLAIATLTGLWRWALQPDTTRTRRPAPARTRAASPAGRR
jgi:cytochrome c-type biogenesis protein